MIAGMIYTAIREVIDDMRGDQHLLISFFSGLLLIIPFIPLYSPVMFLTIIGGLAIGSLSPDADAKDAAIFHNRINIRGTLGDLLRPLGFIMPVFGYIIRYMIYCPVSLILWAILRKKGKPRHRGLLHSIPGMLLTVVLIGFYLRVFFVSLGMDISYLILPFLSAFTAGFLMHLLEDSCTPSGVAWLFPFFNNRVYGDIRVDRRREYRPAVMTFTLGIAIIALFLTGSYYQVVTIMSIWIPALMLLAVWAVFLFCAGLKV